MAWPGYCGALLVAFMVSAASPRAAAATDPVRSSAAPQLAAGELSLLARVVQREAENQPVVGQRAVAWTAVNRLRAGTYGKTLRHVLLARHQYARPKPLRPNSPAYRTALMAALMATRGSLPDDSRGATNFIRCDMKRRPAWVAKFKLTTRILDHCFFKAKEPHHD